MVNDRGETLAEMPIGNFHMDSVLFGGFLSAIQMYSQKVSGTELRELSLDDYRIIISRINSMYLVTIHDIMDKNAIDMNSKLCHIVEDNYGEVIADETIEMLCNAARVDSKDKK